MIVVDGKVLPLVRERRPSVGNSVARIPSVRKAGSLVSNKDGLIRGVDIHGHGVG